MVKDKIRLQMSQSGFNFSQYVLPHFYGHLDYGLSLKLVT